MRGFGECIGFKSISLKSDLLISATRVSHLVYSSLNHLVCGPGGRQLVRMKN